MFSTKSKVENIFVYLYFGMSYFISIDIVLASVHKTNFIDKYASFKPMKTATLIIISVLLETILDEVYGIIENLF